MSDDQQTPTHDEAPASPVEERPRRGIGGVFRLLWFSQTLSLLGTGLTGFALGIWVYQHTGSVTQFVALAAIGSAGGLLLSPLAGVLADAWDRRWAMMLGDAAAALRVVVLGTLLAGGRLEVWHVYVAVLVRAVAEAIQAPAFMASVTMLVPRDQLARANGFLQFGGAGARILAPALGGFLMTRVALEKILLIDIATFGVALVVLLSVRIPKPPPSADPNARRPSVWTNAFYGWRYIRARPLLWRLVLFFAVFNMIIGLSMVLVSPLVLSFADATALGAVQATAGIAGLLGGLLMSTWGGPARRINGILFATPILGLGLAVVGARADVALIATGVFIFSFTIPVISACNMAIWQLTVEPAVQGRVFAMQRVLAQSTGPFSLLGAGILADRLMEPSMAAGGRLATIFGPWIGVGPGRGMALLITVMGLALATTAIVIARFGGLQAIEQEPDTEDSRPAAESQPAKASA